MGEQECVDRGLGSCSFGKEGGGWRGVNDFWSTGRGEVKARLYESRISFFSSSLYFLLFYVVVPLLSPQY